MPLPLLVALVSLHQAGGTETPWVDLGAGCCDSNSYIFDGYITWTSASLESCKSFCLDKGVDCGYVVFGWPGSPWCRVLSSTSDCTSLNSEPGDCGSSGATGVRTYAFRDTCDCSVVLYQHWAPECRGGSYFGATQQYGDGDRWRWMTPFGVQGKISEFVIQGESQCTMRVTTTDDPNPFIYKSGAHCHPLPTGNDNINKVMLTCEDTPADTGTSTTETSTSDTPGTSDTSTSTSSTVSPTTGTHTTTTSLTTSSSRTATATSSSTTESTVSTYTRTTSSSISTYTRTTSSSISTYTRTTSSSISTYTRTTSSSVSTVSSVTTRTTTTRSTSSQTSTTSLATSTATSSSTSLTSSTLTSMSATSSTTATATLTTVSETSSTNSGTSTTTATTVCADNPGFKDRLGFGCERWKLTECLGSDDVLALAYGEDGLDEVFSSCKWSCGLCPKGAYPAAASAGVEVEEAGGNWSIIVPIVLVIVILCFAVFLRVITLAKSRRVVNRILDFE